MNKAISFLMPTRGKGCLERHKGVIVAIDSIADLCYDKNNVEVIIKLDTDDPETIQFCNTLRTDIDIRVIVSDRLRGYNSLHEHCAEMGRLANGIWLSPFSDDSILETPNYDLIFLENAYLTTYVLNPVHGMPQHASLYPIVHRRLFELQGGFGPGAHFDVYWEFVNRVIPVYVPVNVKYNHDRRFELPHHADNFDIGPEDGTNDYFYNELNRVVDLIKKERGIE